MGQHLGLAGHIPDWIDHLSEVQEIQNDFAIRARQSGKTAISQAEAGDYRRGALNTFLPAGHSQTAIGIGAAS
jgi:hypothetical protein